MRPYATSVCGLKVAFKSTKAPVAYVLNAALTYAWAKLAQARSCTTLLRTCPSAVDTPRTHCVKILLNALYRCKITVHNTHTHTHTHVRVCVFVCVCVFVRVRVRVRVCKYIYAISTPRYPPTPHVFDMSLNRH